MAQKYIMEFVLCTHFQLPDSLKVSSLNKLGDIIKYPEKCKMQSKNTSIIIII